MKIKCIVLSASALLLCTIMYGCSMFSNSNPPSSISLISQSVSDVTSLPSSTKQEIEDTFTIDEDVLKHYAGEFAKYFHEPNLFPQIKDEPNLFSFLICNTYFQLIENGKELKNISGKDYMTTVYISLADMKETAKLLLNLDNPFSENYFTNEDFKYVAEAEAFKHTPYSPPAYNTKTTSIIKENGTYHLVVEIENVENRPISKPIVYLFKPIKNEYEKIVFQFMGYSYQD